MTVNSDCQFSFSPLPKQYEHVDPGLDVAAVARQSNGLSGADLAEVARQAALIPVKEFILEERRLMEDDLSEVFEKQHKRLSFLLTC